MNINVYRQACRHGYTHAGSAQACIQTHVCTDMCGRDDHRKGDLRLLRHKWPWHVTRLCIHMRLGLHSCMRIHMHIDMREGMDARSLSKQHERLQSFARLPVRSLDIPSLGSINRRRGVGGVA